MFMRILTWWCGIGYSKPYALRHLSLNQMCLPIPPIPHIHLKPTSYLIAISSIGSWMMLSIPIPFIMPNRLTDAPYLALGNYAIYAYLICLTHVPYIFNYTILDFICQALNCIYLMFFSMASLSSLSTLHQYRYTISIPTATPAVNKPRQANRIIIH